MGMALGDADSDGDLDLYLTHFTDEDNTYYEQVTPGVWFDRTSAVGLDEPTQRMLAFGTEWIDADNDGTPELIVANGNVDDFRHKGNPLRMLPQFFARHRDGSWKQVAPEVCGEYFSKPLVGRSLATSDINRDGLPDVLITHMFDPVAVLINQTDDPGRSIRVRLKGVSCDRDAIGVIVRAEIGQATRQFQLTGGDGFQCSNERVVHIGLGSSETAKNVTIHWPDGSRQLIGDLAAGESAHGGDYLVVQGQDVYAY